MTNEEVIEILKKIDIHYNTDYSENKEMIFEWYKYLKKYSVEDVKAKFEYYLEYYPNYPPKVFNLIQGLKTIEQKEQLRNLHTICPYCKKIVSMEKYDEHYHRCMDIDYIEKNVKKYLNQQIIRDDYYNMTKEELKKRFIKIAKIVVEKTPNDLEKKCLRKFLEGVN